MIKWLITVVVALFLLSGLMPLLRKLGVGRLPGDFSFVVRGRRIDLPVASTVLLSLIAAAVAKLI